MHYLNNNFWRMIIGLALVLVMGVVFLAVGQNYGHDKDVDPENYVASPDNN